MTRSTNWRWGLLLAVLAAAALWLGWVGFIASDDSLYYAGAMRWLTDPPFAGDTHWSTRFPLTLTFAAVLTVMGQGFAAFAATAVLFYAAIIAVTGLYAAKVGGQRAGWISALLTATMPVIVSHATTVSVDLLEASALLLGALLVSGATATWRGVAAGACFGVAVLCRETSLLPIVGLAPLFLLGRPVPRRILIASGIGFLLVIGGEALFQYAMTGDPLRRYAIAFHHDEHIDRAANMEGNFLLHPAIDPLLVLLVNDDFGLLFWLGGAAVAFGALRGISAEGRKRLIVLSAMALASFVLVSVLYSKLVLNPRYFTLPALVAAIVLAMWLDRIAPRWRALLLAAVVGSNLLLMSVGNAHPRWEMEALVDAARAHPAQTVIGDENDVRRAALPLGFAGQQNIASGAPQPGVLLVAREDQSPVGTVIARYPSPPTRLGGILRGLGLEPFVPAPVAHRMFAPSPPVVLVRTPR
ncbi:glycosyltransferase family 39 protein [Sphingomonas sp. SUN019]|uniref:glycosyltransferase family 39 protein n=1 Tax=Sphingomonas sp. SUN019 TaxID=2937788 RepID=UPI0021647A5A|nr:glycosyltransferase family 39 protein [Sphingomonas sp. SUN019]UVO49453.1 glycosyltransferase family 39 protein [Sphingomonas sp. SUN019]